MTPWETAGAAAVVGPLEVVDDDGVTPVGGEQRREPGPADDDRDLGGARRDTDAELVADTPEAVKRRRERVGRDLGIDQAGHGGEQVGDVVVGGEPPLELGGPSPGAVTRTDAETGVAKAAQQLARADTERAGGERTGPLLDPDVVVIALEGHTPHTDLVGERVELLEIAVAAQVRPPVAAPGPDRVVDQDGHTREPTDRTAGDRRCPTSGVYADLMVPSDDSRSAAGPTEGGDRVRLEVPALTDYTPIARLTASGLALRNGFALDQVEAWRDAVDRALALLVPATPGGERLSVTFDLSATSIGVVFCCPPPQHTARTDDPCAWREFSLGVAALVDTVEVRPEDGRIALVKSTGAR